MSDHKETVQKELQWLRDSDIRLKVLDMPTTMVDFPEDQAWAARLINDVLIETFNATVAQEYTEHKQKQREGIDAANRKEPKVLRAQGPLGDRRNLNPGSRKDFGRFASDVLEVGSVRTLTFLI